MEQVDEGLEEAMNFLRKLPDEISTGRRKSVLVSVMNDELVVSHLGVTAPEAFFMLMQVIHDYKLMMAPSDGETH
jgi:hypothetical protein